jgi:hypothetical protein
MLKHGVPELLLGVKMEDLKVFQKKIKKHYQLAPVLYDSGIYHARHLATSEYTVAWVASESLHGREMVAWIESETGKIATAGWATLSGLWPSPTIASWIPTSSVIC